jgi:esterase/lipase
MGDRDDLIAVELERFERDYAAWFREGESKPMDVGRPRILAPERPESGVILVHGYMAAPEEPAPLARRLRDLGLAVYLPRLPGHGTSPANLSAVRWRDWAAAVEDAYSLVSSLCGKWVIAGFSTGAGLALHEAALHPERYAACISISAPLELKGRNARFIRPADRLIFLARALGLAGAEAGYFPNHPDNPEINYHRNCYHGVAEVQRLMARVERELPSIVMPVLVMQGTGDTVIPASAPERIVATLSSKDKRLVLVPSDKHGIVRGPALEATFAAIRDFLRPIAGLPGAAAAQPSPSTSSM